MSKYSNPFPQHFDKKGNPLAFYTVYFGLPNEDTKENPKAPFAQSDLDPSSALPTFQVLDSQGAYGSDIFLNGEYSIRIETPLGALWRESAVVTGIFDPSLGTIDAKNVTYTAPFSDSVASNVEVKLSERVSVKDFGTVGDGVADDTAAFILARDTGTSVHVPEGVYLVDAMTFATDDHLIFDKGAILKPSAGQTVDIRCEIEAGRYRIFDDSLGTVIGRTPVGKPEWFHAGGDDYIPAFDSVQLLSRAVVVSGGTIYTCRSQYNQVDGVVLSVEGGSNRPQFDVSASFGVIKFDGSTGFTGNRGFNGENYGGCSGITFEFADITNTAFVCFDLHYFESSFWDDVNVIIRRCSISRALLMHNGPLTYKEFNIAYVEAVTFSAEPYWISATQISFESCNFYLPDNLVTLAATDMWFIKVTVAMTFEATNFESTPGEGFATIHGQGRFYFESCNMRCDRDTGVEGDTTFLHLDNSIDTGLGNISNAEFNNCRITPHEQFGGSSYKMFNIPFKYTSKDGLSTNELTREYFGSITDSSQFSLHGWSFNQNAGAVGSSEEASQRFYGQHVGFESTVAAAASFTIDLPPLFHYEKTVFQGALIKILLSSRDGASTISKHGEWNIGMTTNAVARFSQITELVNEASNWTVTVDDAGIHFESAVDVDGVVYEVRTFTSRSIIPA